VAVQSEQWDRAAIAPGKDPPAMTRLRVALTATLVVSMAAAVPPARASQDAPPAVRNPDMSGLHDFDLRVGRWKVHNHVLKERLAGSRDWEDSDGVQTFQQLLGGAVNVDENIFHMPRGDYPGVTLRAYNPATGEWAIWWLDGRNPHGSLDPPMKGRFRNGVGTFYADDTLRGRPIKVRFLWTKFTRNSAHWEQAYSGDGGKTWETNWVTDFERIE
jgi:hypothetical protein